MEKPSLRPQRPYFGSGPTCKPPGWSVSWLEGALVGRSHRSKEGIARIQEVLEESRQILGIPSDYAIALMPGSDTGAFEAALWSLLGDRPVDFLVWDVFSENWARDGVEALKLQETRVFKAPCGQMPDLSEVKAHHDVVFVWNGTTSGVCLPHGDWISETREGLTFCDATSAVFAVDLPWDKLDVTTYSWQKVLGGEAGHGILILSPRAVDRLNSYHPSWPIPRLFSLRKEGRWNDLLFKGHTLNTPSLLCVEDFWHSLQWIKKEGGLSSSIEKVRSQGMALLEASLKTSWLRPLADDLSCASPISVCLKIIDPQIQDLSVEGQWDFIKKITELLDQEKVAFDIKNHALSVPSFRIWAGPTVDRQDLEALFLWLEYAYQKTKKEN